MRALGGVTYFLNFVVACIIIEVPEAFTVLFGLLSYLCDSPHYFVPEEVEICCSILLIYSFPLLIKYAGDVMLCLFEINSLHNNFC